MDRADVSEALDLCKQHGLALEPLQTWSRPFTTIDRLCREGAMPFDPLAHLARIRTVAEMAAAFRPSRPHENRT
jgi:hypothetical protein